MVNRNNVRMINENDSICLAELNEHLPDHITIHHRYKELPKDIINFINEIPGVSSVVTHFRYQTDIIIGKCFTDNDSQISIILEIRNKITERWEKDKW